MLYFYYSAVTTIFKFLLEKLLSPLLHKKDLYMNICTARRSHNPKKQIMIPFFSLSFFLANQHLGSSLSHSSSPPHLSHCQALLAWPSARLFLPAEKKRLKIARHTTQHQKGSKATYRPIYIYTTTRRRPDATRRISLSLSLS